MRPKTEPAAVRELRRIREKMLAEEKRVGSGKYWAEANKQGREFARQLGLKYIESPSSALTLREEPAKKRR